MGRRKTGKAPGRVSHFSGEKAEWLSRFETELQDTDDPGDVYTDATNQFLIRYGYDLPFGENVDGDPEDHPPSDDPVNDEEQD